MQIKKIINLIVLKFVFCLALTGSLNIKAAQVGPSYFSKILSYMPTKEGMKSIVNKVMDHPHSKRLLEFYGNYPNEISSLIFSAYEVITKKEFKDKVTGVISTVSSTYAHAMIIKLLADLDVIKGDVNYSTDPAQAIIKYHLISKVISDLLFKTAHYAANKVVDKFVKKAVK